MRNLGDICPDYGTPIIHRLIKQFCISARRSNILYVCKHTQQYLPPISTVSVAGWFKLPRHSYLPPKFTFTPTKFRVCSSPLDVTYCTETDVNNSEMRLLSLNQPRNFSPPLTVHVDDVVSPRLGRRDVGETLKPAP